MIVTVQGLKIYYEAAGEGAPVVLLHGWGVDSGNLRPLLKEIKDKLPRRVYALDFPGFGYSEQPPRSWDVGDYSRFLEEFLDALHLEKVDLIGHSFGGRVAIKLTSDTGKRVGRLVLIDSAGIRPKRKAGYHLKVSLAKTLRRITQAAPGLAKAVGLDRMVANQGSEDYRRAGAMRATFVKVVNEDLTGCLDAIGCPTLLIWGEKDESTPLTDGRLMNARISGSRLEVIPGAGHFPYLEKPKAVASALIPFLS